MQILIVDGWTHDGNLDHFRAGCVTQAQIFEALVKETVPGVATTTVTTHEPAAAAEIDLDDFQVAIWTGGGGNIYEDNDFNRDQLSLCERVLAEVPYLWGSCWGLQVVVTVLGGLVTEARMPEIGIASDIVVRSSDPAQKLFREKHGKFDAPTHHGDEVSRLPAAFEILAENKVTLQAVAANDGKILCTQYHPELPYDYVRKLLEFWEPNYRDLYTAQEFQTLLATLSAREAADRNQRTTEFRNWLGSIPDEPG